MILKSGKGVKITQGQIWVVQQMFQDCPSEALQELCCSCEVGRTLLCRSKTPVVGSPGRCCLMVARNHSRVSQYEAALIVVPFFMESTNSTPLQSQTPQLSLCQQICTSWIFLIVGAWDVSTPCLHILSLQSNGWTHILSPVTMHLRKPWPWMAYCWRNERALTILCTLWNPSRTNLMEA